MAEQTAGLDQVILQNNVGFLKNFFLANSDNVPVHSDISKG